MAYICGYMNPYTVFNQQWIQPRQRELRVRLSAYSVREFNRVVRHGAAISALARLSNNVYVGEGTVIEANCHVARSVILKRCRILENVVLENCLVLEGC